MAGLLDDTDTARHTVPVERLSPAVGYPNTLGRQDRCLPTSAAVAWVLACLWVAELLACPGRLRCEVNPGQLIRRLSLR
jgi:hypothetical protein